MDIDTERKNISISGGLILSTKWSEFWDTNNISF